VIFLIYQKASFLMALCLEKLFKKGKKCHVTLWFTPPPTSLLLVLLVIQADLVIRGLFIHGFAYSQM